MSAGHLPGLRLALLSLGALQRRQAAVLKFRGHCGQHLWKVELVPPAAPSPHLGSRLGRDRSSAPPSTGSPWQGHPQSTAAPPKTAGCPKLRYPILKAQVGCLGRRQPGGQQVAFPSPRGWCFLVSAAQHGAKQLRNSSSALIPCSGAQVWAGLVAPWGLREGPPRAPGGDRGLCSAGFTVSVHTGCLLLVSVSLSLFPWGHQSYWMRGPPGSRVTSS